MRCLDDASRNETEDRDVSHQPHVVLHLGVPGKRVKEHDQRRLETPDQTDHKVKRREHGFGPFAERGGHRWGQRLPLHLSKADRGSHHGFTSSLYR